MAKIQVTAKIDGGTHHKYGPINKGQTYTIDEADFGDQLFERPPGFESPHEKAARESMAALAAPSVPSEPPEPSDQSEEYHEEVH